MTLSHERRDLVNDGAYTCIDSFLLWDPPCHAFFYIEGATLRHDIERNTLKKHDTRRLTVGISLSWDTHNQKTFTA